MPKSLFGRALAIIIVPVAVMQIVVAYIFFDAHWQTVTSRLSDGVAADIALSTELYQQSPGLERAESIDGMIRKSTGLSVQLRPGETLPESNRRSFFSNLDRTLRKALDRTLDQEFWFDTTRYPNHVDIRVKVDEGVLYFIAPRDKVFASTGFIFLFWLIFATIILTLVSILFILNQARPIVRLAEAADAFGKGRDIGKFKPSGATEVRQASQSFLDMRQRILRHIDQRTTLLAGVSHDLRTPLTRLKLHLAMSEDSAENRAARQDIVDMEGMLDAYLDFARGLAGEEITDVDLSALMEDIAVKAPCPIETDIAEDIHVQGREGVLRRAITNLVNNGCAYGQDAKLTLQRSQTGKRIYILVDDSGPGIAPELRDEAFKPFIRLGEARTQNVKGVGLGLSIAKDAAHAHGGELTLEDSPQGGLRCRMWLPA